MHLTETSKEAIKTTDEDILKTSTQEAGEVEVIEADNPPEYYIEGATSIPIIRGVDNSGALVETIRRAINKALPDDE